jgi:hypothetical protein
VQREKGDLTKSERWVAKLGRWVATSGRWVAKLVPHLLANAALCVRIKTSLKNTKWAK